ncbi:Adenylate kinase 1, partial [Tetrabaena socialis]
CCVLAACWWLLKQPNARLRQLMRGSTGDGAESAPEGAAPAQAADADAPVVASSRPASITGPTAGGLPTAKAANQPAAFRLQLRRKDRALGPSLPPQVAGVDDLTGEPLMQRKDDNAETLKARLGAFHSQTTPVIDYYAARVVALKADRPQDEVAKQITSALGN